MAAHILFPALIVCAIIAGFSIGYPDVSALSGLYLVVAMALYQLMGRLSQAGARRQFGFAGRVYALIFGLGAFYVASDAYVLEQAYFQYPATTRWFVMFFFAVLVLCLVTMMRRSTAAEIYVTRPQFVSVGIGIFISVMTLVLIGMTALAGWPFQAVLYRVLFLLGCAWLVQLGFYEESPATSIVSAVFLVLGVMTAYLDILWPYRETLAFLIGAGLLFVLVAGLSTMWLRSRLRDLTP